MIRCLFGIHRWMMGPHRLRGVNQALGRIHCDRCGKRRG